MTFDILIKNAKGLVMEDDEEFKWIGVKKDKIIQFGDMDNYGDYVDEHTSIIDAMGNTVLPGFIDSHFHMVQSGLNHMNLDFSQVKSFQEIAEKIEEFHKAHPEDVVYGTGIEVDKLEEKKMPDREFLDAYCKDAPVWLSSVEYQISSLNTYGMLYFKVPFTAKGIQYNKEQMPTGVFLGAANAFLRKNILNSIENKERKESIDELVGKLIANGITSVNAMEGGFVYSDKDADFVYDNLNSFAVDVEIFYQTMDLDKIVELGLKRVGAGIYVDGTLGARTAALSFDYADDKNNQGSLLLPQEELDEFVLNCYKKDLQLVLYTIGDRAIESALVSHEKAIKKTGKKNLRHRLEHVELANPNQLARAKAMNILFSMQPTYETYWGMKGGMYEKRLGKQYGQTNRFREILDQGICICGGSDSDVTKPNPILGIYSAVNHPVKKHRCSLYEAIEMFTINGAYGIFAEGYKGSLKEGKLADLIILDQDLFSMDSRKLLESKVVFTMKSGEILYNELGEKC